MSGRRRTVAVAIAITAPVFVATIFGGMTAGLSDAANAFAHANGDRIAISTLELNNSSRTDSKVTPAMEQRLKAFPGVAAIEHQYYFAVNHPDLLASINAMEGKPPSYRVYRGVSGVDAFARGEVMIGPALARAKHLRPGDSVRVPGRLGWSSFVVAGIWASPESVGYSITMSADQLRRLAGVRQAGSLLLVPSAGVQPAALATAIRAANIDPRLRVLSPDDYATEAKTSFSSIAAPFKALQIAMLIVALVATTSTLVLSAAQRRRDNAVLAALGMSPRDLARSTMVETIVTAVTVTIVAAFCAQLTLLSFTWASGLATGLEVPYRISVATVISAAAFTTLIALIGSVLPAWRTARTNVMTALRTA